MRDESEIWQISPKAFEGLLSSLHSNREQAASRYESLRQRLTAFFMRRQFVQAESLADEVLDRIARRIESGEQIGSVESYAYGVAKFVAHEEQRREMRRDVSSRQYLQNTSLLSDTMDEERLQEAMEDCLRRQSTANREVLVAYYTFQGSQKIESRRQLAVRLQLTPSGLRKHTFRLRRMIEACVRARLAGKAGQTKNG